MAHFDGSPLDIRTRKKLKIISAALAAVVLLLLFYPLGHFDRSHVHADFRSLREPFRHVEAAFYLDGGSIRTSIVDAEGQVMHIMFPSSLEPDTGNRYDRIFVGAPYWRDTNAVEIPYTYDSRLYVADVISRYADPGVERDISLIALRGAPKDFVAGFFRALTRFANES